jgi:uncharacterized membrane protein
MNTQRFKNYAFWSAMFAFLVMVLQTFHIVDLPANYSDIINSFLGLLVLAGIINDPNTTDSKWYKDDPTIPSDFDEK